MARFKSLSLAALFLVAVIGTGCSRSPKATVQDFDTYQIVQISDLQLLAGEGFAVEERGRHHVLLASTTIPHTTIRVTRDPNPPRNFRLDAQTIKRRTLRDIPNSGVTSTQYYRVGDRDAVRMHIRGEGKDASDRFGVLTVMREGDKTAIVQVLGPFSRRTELTRLAETINRNISLTGDDSLLLEVAGN